MTSTEAVGQPEPLLRSGTGHRVWIGAHSEFLPDRVSPVKQDKGGDQDEGYNAEPEQLSGDAFLFFVAKPPFPAIATQTLAVTTLAAVFADAAAALTSLLDGRQRFLGGQVLQDGEVGALMNLLLLRELLNELKNAIRACERRRQAELFPLETWLASAREPPFKVS